MLASGPINKLPVDVLGIVLNNFEDQELNQMKLVCKKFLTTADQILHQRPFASIIASNIGACILKSDAELIDSLKEFSAESGKYANGSYKLQVYNKKTKQFEEKISINFINFNNPLGNGELNKIYHSEDCFDSYLFGCDKMQSQVGNHDFQIEISCQLSQAREIGRAEEAIINNQLLILEQVKELLEKNPDDDFSLDELNNSPVAAKKFIAKYAHELVLTPFQTDLIKIIAEFPENDKDIDEEVQKQKFEQFGKKFEDLMIAYEYATKEDFKNEKAKNNKASCLAYNIVNIEEDISTSIHDYFDLVQTQAIDQIQAAHAWRAQALHDEFLARKQHSDKIIKFGVVIGIVLVAIVIANDIFKTFSEFDSYNSN